MRDYLTTAVELAGFALVCLAAFMFAPVVGFAVTGGVLVCLGYLGGSGGK